MDKQAIVKAYVRRIKRGVITIENVHESLRKEVEKMLNKEIKDSV